MTVLDQTTAVQRCHRYRMTDNAQQNRQQNSPPVARVLRHGRRKQTDYAGRQQVNQHGNAGTVGSVNHMFETPEIGLWPRWRLAKRGVNAEGDIKINVRATGIKRLKSFAHDLQDFERTAGDAPDRARGQVLRRWEKIQLIRPLNRPFRVVSSHLRVTNNWIEGSASKPARDASATCQIPANSSLPCFGHRDLRPGPNVYLSALGLKAVTTTSGDLLCA